jgi:hypothetical protein
MSDVGIVAVVRHGLPELRSALRTIRETAPSDAQLAVIAIDMGDQDATYLVRQYLRGRIQALEFDHRESFGDHCGLDRSFQLVQGDYVARVDDTFEFKPGWVEKAVAALEAESDIGCLSLVPPSDYHRGRGRPRTVNVEPIEVERLDMRCYVVRREHVAQHGCQALADQPCGCGFQSVLRAEGLRLAFLPGQVSPVLREEAPPSYGVWALEEQLPPHEGANGALQRLKQAYHLGDDVLLTCLSCGGTEMETIAARIRFCERHQVAIGFWYELRCPECGELLYKDDYQFQCVD